MNDENDLAKVRERAQAAELLARNRGWEIAVALSWRDIETAPKDGTPFLVFWDDSPVAGMGHADMVSGWTEYQEILSFGEPPAKAWMSIPPLHKTGCRLLEDALCSCGLADLVSAALEQREAKPKMFPVMDEASEIVSLRAAKDTAEHQLASYKREIERIDDQRVAQRRDLASLQQQITGVVEQWRSHTAGMVTESTTHWDRERRAYVEGKIRGITYCAQKLADLLTQLAERSPT